MNEAVPDDAVEPVAQAGEERVQANDRGVVELVYEELLAQQAEDGGLRAVQRVGSRSSTT